ncbi:MAG TPA: magnesium transporter [Tepidisphaeraceae bacterium]|jgi:magnesium transporter
MIDATPPTSAEDQDASAVRDHGMSVDLRSIDLVTTEEMLTSSPRTLSELIEEAPSEQGASVLERLPLDRAVGVAEYLDPKTAARIFKEVDAGTAAALVLGMNRVEAAMVLAEMDPDDRVDILGLVDPEAHDELLAELDVAKRAETRHLESYPPDTAGGIMTTQVTALYEYLTVDDAVGLLRKLSEELEQMFYVYAIDRLGRLVGVLSMRDLILAKPSRRLRDIMIKGVRSVPATMDQEEVARIMRGSGYLAMPVVDDELRLIGLITVDDVIDVVQEEATEDVLKMFGVGGEERLNSPWYFSFKSRIWWLLINLGTAFMAGAVVGVFEETITKIAVLAIYMPIIAGMGGNASAQAMAVSVRGLSTGRVDGKLLRHVLKRELYVGILTGIVCGLVTALIALVWQGNPALGLLVCAALLINHTLACASGAGIPFIMKRLGFDPAQSATIFATTVTDVGGFFALLGLATVFYKWLV